MSKIWLIMRREYLIRVRNKTFLISTFLLPLVIILFIAGSVVLSEQTKTRHRIAVTDVNVITGKESKYNSITDLTIGISHYGR